MSLNCPLASRTAESFVPLLVRCVVRGPRYADGALQERQGRQSSGRLRGTLGVSRMNAANCLNLSGAAKQSRKPHGRMTASGGAEDVMDHTVASIRLCAVSHMLLRAP
jgi:hypothetical protein